MILYTFYKVIRNMSDFIHNFCCMGKIVLYFIHSFMCMSKIVYIY